MRNQRGKVMKKIEAMEIAPLRSNLLIEYIDAFLMDTEMINPKIRISSIKFDGDSEPVKTFDIYIPENGFERHFNTGITFQQRDVLDNQILNDLAEHYMELSNVKLSTFTTIRSGRFQNFDGVFIQGNDGRTVSINMGYVDQNIINQYNTKLQEYAKNAIGPSL